MIKIIYRIEKGKEKKMCGYSLVRTYNPCERILPISYISDFLNLFSPRENFEIIFRSLGTPSKTDLLGSGENFTLLLVAMWEEFHSYIGGQNGTQMAKRSLVSWSWLSQVALSLELFRLIKWKVKQPKLKKPLETSG